MPVALSQLHATALQWVLWAHDQKHRRQPDTLLAHAHVPHSGHKVIVEILLASGADTSIQNDAGHTPRQLAHDAGYDDVVALL